MTTSPPKEHNFDAIPTVHSLDEFFHRKYEDVGEGDHHEFQQVATAEEILAEQEAHADHHIHMPSPSYWPIVLAFGLPIMAYGIIYNTSCSIVVGAPDHRCSACTAGRSSRRSADDDRLRPAVRQRATRSWRPSDVTITDRTSGRRRRARVDAPARRRPTTAATVTVTPTHTTTGLSNNKLAMWLFLGSECLLFGGLISTYMLYRGRTQRRTRARPDLRHPVHVGRRASCC